MMNVSIHHGISFDGLDVSFVVILIVRESVSEAHISDIQKIIIFDERDPPFFEIELRL